MVQRRTNPDENQRKVLPFLKWAGGKRWLVDRAISIIPNRFSRYIEPFLGSGAFYFHLAPTQAVLSDLNLELIDTYLAIKEDWAEVLSRLRIHQNSHCSGHYYKVRNQKLRNPFARAAQFIYLNRTCWNGLYRVNRSGEFNVPIGTKKNVVLDTDDFEAVANHLDHAQLSSGDFEPVIDGATKGDMVFADPPYTVKHNHNGFVKYNERLFNWADQIRLKDCLLRARLRGVSVIATNAHHPSIVRLYRDDFHIERVRRLSVISGRASGRGYAEELIIRGE